MIGRALLVTAAGFAVGAVVGFVWSQETKAAAPNYVGVETEIADGKVIVIADFKGAALAGVDGLLARFGL